MTTVAHIVYLCLTATIAFNSKLFEHRCLQDVNNSNWSNNVFDRGMFNVFRFYLTILSHNPAVKPSCVETILYIIDIAGLIKAFKIENKCGDKNARIDLSPISLRKT